MMKESIFIALALLAFTSFYGFSRVDTLKAENQVLQSQLEALEEDNKRLTNQLIGSFAR